MFDSPLVDTAISLFALYALLSLLCTAISEAISSVFMMRARYLANGVYELLGNTELRKQFYEHPMICSLGKRTNCLIEFFLGENTAAKYVLEDKKLIFPSYIPPRNFALALLDVIAPAKATSALGTAPAGTPLPPDPGVAALRDVVTGQILGPINATAQAIEGRAKAELESRKLELEKKSQENAIAPDPDWTTIEPQLQQAVKDAEEFATKASGLVGKACSQAVLESNEIVRRAVLTAIDAADNDMEKVRKNIEEWYDNAMVRVGGRFKRGIQVVLIVIGLIVAVFLNADTIRIVDTLTKNPKLARETAAKVEANLGAWQKILEAQELARASSPATTAGESVDAAKEQVTKDKIAAQLTEIQSLSKTVTDLGLPLRWDCEAKSYFCKNPVWSFTGWILTAFAIPLGAPFWFDLLSKVMAIRGSGKTPVEQAKSAANK